MAPVLYLFIIMAFAEILDISWKQLGNKVITFNTRTNSPRDRDSLTRQAPKTFSEGTLLYLFNVLYVDDGAFPFVEENGSLGDIIIRSLYNGAFVGLIY